MKTVTRDYCAGFFDGEGSVMIRYDRRCDSYILKVAVSNTVLAPLLAMKARWGGCIVSCKPRHQGHSGWGEWHLQGRGAAPFLRAIRPFVLCKGEQIDIALELLATYQMTPGRGRHLPPSIKAIRAALKERLHSLKTKGRGLKGAH